MAEREQIIFTGTWTSEFNLDSLKVGFLVEKGGEPLRAWFAEFIDWVFGSIGIIAEQKGLEVGRQYYKDAGRQIAKFLERVPFADREFLTKLYEEKMRNVDLRYGMQAIICIPARGGTEKSLFMDQQPSRYEVPTDAARIGGGKVSRYGGAE